MIGKKVVYSVQINDFKLEIEVVCPNCSETVLIHDSYDSDQERICLSDGCEDLRFKVAADIQVFTGVKQPE